MREYDHASDKTQFLKDRNEQNVAVCMVRFI